MENEEMTVDEAYKELKGDMANLKADILTKFESDMSKMRTWVISLFVGSMIVIGTLLGAYANMIIALLK